VSDNNFLSLFKKNLLQKEEPPPKNSLLEKENSQQEKIKPKEKPSKARSIFAKLGFIPKMLSLKERKVVFVLFAILLTGVLGFGWQYYKNKTQEVPAFGGEYTEGIVGEPKYINPILCHTSEADMSITKLTFASLFKFNSKMELVPELAEKYDISKDGKEYTIYLKKGVKWHDGNELTAKDVLFTTQAIQNPSYKSPLYLSFKNTSCDALDNYTIKFTLKEPFAPFLSNLTVGILPAHIWSIIKPTDASLSDFNTKPIGSGPFQFKELKKDKEGKIKSYTLEQFDNYFGNKPYLSKVTFFFFKTQEELNQEFKKKEILGISRILPQDKEDILIANQNLKTYNIQLPRYYAVFFNPTDESPLKDTNIRLALNHATNKDQIIEDALFGLGVPVHSPILPWMLGYYKDAGNFEFNQEKARALLEKAGWKDSDKNGIREKGGKELEITLITTDWPEYVKISEELTKMWQEVGIKTIIITENIATVQQDFIKPRDYEALLYGEVLGGDPDPYAFWHSTQREDPGLNLTFLGKESIDKTLEQARKEINNKKRIEFYKEFQTEIAKEVPVVFLYSPIHLYGASERVKGIEIDKASTSAERFNDIEKWYMKTRRIKIEN